MDIQIIRPETHDLKKITSEMQTQDWEDLEDNYNLEGVKKFTSNEQNYLILAFIDDKVAGMLTAYTLERMDQKIRAMYVDEVETKPAFRRQGVAKALMNKIIEIAKEKKCFELWIGTETDNEPANKLYSGLNFKTEKEEANIYIYKL